MINKFLQPSNQATGLFQLTLPIAIYFGIQSGAGWGWWMAAVFFWGFVYTVIGNNVGIPTKVYKVIIDVKNQKSAAYIFPNTGLPVADLEKYKLSITEAEKIIHINFNPKLNDSLESKNNWSQ